MDSSLMGKLRFGNKQGAQQVYSRPDVPENTYVAQTPDDMIVKIDNKYRINQNPHTGAEDSIKLGKETYETYEAAQATAQRILDKRNAPPSGDSQLKLDFFA